jgi:hypothetical protein
MRPDLTTMLEDFVEGWEATSRRSGGYMPALATLMRIAADELADKYPVIIPLDPVPPEYAVRPGGGGSCGGLPPSTARTRADAGGVFAKPDHPQRRP